MNKSFLFISYDQRKYTHALHKYPAKFFPELPRYFIQKYSSVGDWVLDPFAGSGTVNLEAMLLGRNSVAIDVDPFARFLIQAKTTIIDRNKLERVKHDIEERLADFDYSCKITLPEFPYRDHWFEPYILQELAYLKETILNLHTSMNVKQFLLAVFSSVIRAVSNADNNCTRTVVRKRLNKKIVPNDAIRRFMMRLNDQIKRMPERPTQAGKVLVPNTGDARNISCKNNFKLAVTSPPYLNAVDYPRTHQLEMYWLGLANGSLVDIKKTHVGTEVVYKQDYKDLHLTGEPQADDAIERIFDSDPRRAFIAYKYLKDMRQTFQSVYDTLEKRGHYVVVVGNNSVRGVTFENWEYFIPMSKDVGFSLENHFESEIINHYIKVPRKERINADHILILTK